MIILGIETSCDDTGIALIEGNRKGCRILSNVVSSQIKIHAPYGGVVPNLAARAHLENIGPCLEEALRKAKNPKIDLIAVTIGPGLIPCLLVGVNFAKALAYAWQKPIMRINHIEGHIYANWLEHQSKVRLLKQKNLRFDLSSATSSRSLLARSNLNKPWTPEVKPLAFPILCLVVSGGHTQLTLMKNYNKYQLLGETRDDAAGEAFDKVAKLLNLGYPGGPIISQKAKKGNPKAFDLPRPMINSNNFDFSFSGLKTAVLYLVKNKFEIRNQGSTFRAKLQRFDLLSGTSKRSLLQRSNLFRSQGQTLISQTFINNIAASFQQAVIDVLISKTIKAAKEYKVKTVLLSGGVAANQELRQQMTEKIKKESFRFQVPSFKLCTDNAAMIAAAAYYKKRPALKRSWSKIEANANLKLI